jgi:radical SAM superfamily enzyme YgiQ (UPF0313 family)/ADP-heptose:LPS heptosyltransferase
LEARDIAVMNKRILLTTSAAPSQAPVSTPEKRVPIGVGFLISVLRNAGHSVFFIDNYLQPDSFLENDYLQKNDIDYVGIYANTICYRDTLRMFHKLEWFRQTNKWKGKIIVGGPHTSVCLNTIPDFVDYVVQGEGEKAILDIVENRVTERVVKYPRIKNLDELPMPAWDYFVKLPYHWNVSWFPEKPIMTMNTSRGCPFKCNFCSVNSIWGREYTCFSAERVVSDIEYLIKEHGAKGIYFREDNFTFNKQRLKEFCELMIKKKLNIPWACESRVSNIDREGIELMHRAGVRGFYFGVESGSQRVLNFINKGITVEQTRNAFKLCNEFGINAAASIMVGIPTETDAEHNQTLELLKEIKPTASWFNVFTGIPDSELYRYVIKNKLYEFIDDRELIYLKGHNERAKKYYGESWDACIPIKICQGKIVEPETSIVMSVYNGEKYLKDAIDSILRQTYQNFEFIIVDDGSTDETDRILYSYDDPRIRIIKNNKNIGLTKSQNKAIKTARGKYITKMDADDISLPHRLEKMVDFLNDNSDHGFVGHAFYTISSTGKILSLVNVRLDDRDIRANLQKQNQFCGTVLMRKHLFLQCGGYDEEFEFAQDYDLWLRLSELSKMANIAEPLYYWRITEDQISRAKKNEQKYYAKKAIAESKKREVMVSVIMATYNRQTLLREAIDSVLNQTYRNFKLIVVNDGGEDVEGAVTELNVDNNIVYINRKENKGLAAARNLGITMSKSKYLVYLDDDDVIYPEHLELLVTALENSDYKVAYTDSYRVHQEKQKNGKYKTIKKILYPSHDFSKNGILYGNVAPVHCFMHERSCLDEVGLFDENFESHEDWDLWIRLSKKFDFQHIKKLSAEYRFRTDGYQLTRSPGFRKTYTDICNKYRPAVKKVKLERQNQKEIEEKIIPQVRYDPRTMDPIIENVQEENVTTKPQKILVRRKGGIGDVLMITPAVRELKRKYPKSLLVCETDYVNMLKDNQYIDRVEQWGFPKISNYDIVLTPGYGHDCCENWIDAMAKKCDVKLASRKMDVFLTKDQINWAKNKIDANKRCIAFHTGKTCPTREWGIDKFKHVACHYLENGYNIIEVGDRKTTEYMGVGNDCRGCSILQTAALIKECQIFVGVYSVCANIAKAVETPACIIYGSCNPASAGADALEYPIWLDNLECKGCRNRLGMMGDKPIKCQQPEIYCLTKLMPELAIETIDKCIKELK